MIIVKISATLSAIYMCLGTLTALSYKKRTSWGYVGLVVSAIGFTLWGIWWR
jgi:hypothetical protein